MSTIIEKYKGTSLIKLSSMFFALVSAYLIFNNIPADFYSNAIVPFITVGVIAKLTNIGYGQIVIHYFNKYHSKRRSVYSTILLQSIIIFFIVSIILFYFNSTLFNLLNLTKTPNLYLVVGLLFMFTIKQVFNPIIRLDVGLKYYNLLIDFIPSLFIFLYSILLIVKVDSYKFYLEALVLFEFLIFIISLSLVLKQKVFSKKLVNHFDVLRFSLRTYSISVVRVIEDRFEPILLALLNLNNFIIIYEFAYKIFTKMQIVYQIYHVVNFKKLSGYSMQEYQKYFSKIASLWIYMLIYSIISIMVIYLFIIIAIPKMNESIYIVVPLLLSYYFLFFAKQVNMFFVVIGRPEIKAISKFLSFVFRMCLIFYAFKLKIYLPFILGSSYFISEMILFFITIIILSKYYNYKLNFFKFKSFKKLIS